MEFTNPGCSDCDRYFSDRHPWIYFSVLLVLVGIPNRAAISTTTCRKTIMSLRNDHQISHHPKTTFAGQLVCPHCQTAFHRERWQDESDYRRAGKKLRELEHRRGWQC